MYYFCIKKTDRLLLHVCPIILNFFFFYQLYLIKVEQPKYWGFSPLPDKTGKQVFLKQQEKWQMAALWEHPFIHSYCALLSAAWTSRGLSGNKYACRCRRSRFKSCVGKIPWKRKWHSSILAWEILWTEDPGGPWSMGSQRVRYNLATKQQWNVP